MLIQPIAGFQDVLFRARPHSWTGPTEDTGIYLNMLKIDNDTVYLSIAFLDRVDGMLSGKIQFYEAETMGNGSQYLYRCWSISDIGAVIAVITMGAKISISEADTIIDQLEGAAALEREVRRDIVYVSTYTQQPFYLTE